MLHSYLIYTDRQTVKGEDAHGPLHETRWQYDKCSFVLILAFSEVISFHQGHNKGACSVYAVYTRAYQHLNLVIVHACKLPDVRNMLNTVEKQVYFIGASPQGLRNVTCPALRTSSNWRSSVEPPGLSMTSVWPVFWTNTTRFSAHLILFSKFAIPRRGPWQDRCPKHWIRFLSWSVQLPDRSCSSISDST